MRGTENLIAFLTLASLFYRNRFTLAAYSTLLFLCLFAFPGRLAGPDVLSSYFACLAFLMTSILLFHSVRTKLYPYQRSLSKILRQKFIGFLFASFVIGTFLNTLVYLIRLPLGFAGVGGRLIILAETLFHMIWHLLHSVKQRDWRKELKAFLVSLFILVLFGYGMAYSPTRANGYILEKRYEMFGIRTESDSKPTHGASHNLYLGLGLFPNPWGIGYGDANASKAANRIKKGVIYGSNEYFDILEKEYIRIPWEVLGTYWKMFKMTITDTYHDLPLLEYLAFGFFLLLFRLTIGPSLTPYEFTALHFMAISGAVLLQGVVIDPRGGNTFPALFGSFISGIFLLEGALSRFNLANAFRLSTFTKMKFKQILTVTVYLGCVYAGISLGKGAYDYLSPNLKSVFTSDHPMN